MKILLDTCSFIWLISDSNELSANARKIFLESRNTIYLSSISAWEIAIKHSLGKLQLQDKNSELTSFIPAQRVAHGIEELRLDEVSVFHLPKLPTHHRDPFDRILVCQAIQHDLTILTPDPLIRQYAVKTAW